MKTALACVIITIAMINGGIFLKHTIIKALALTLAMLLICLSALAQSVLDPNEGDSYTFNLPEGYDPAAEEDVGALASDDETVRAGATPIPIDPIDMPTPTPRPNLSFTYASFTASKLGLKFEAPADWVMDDSASNEVILYEPAAQMKDNYSAKISIAVSAVSSTYKKSDLKKELSTYISNLGAINYTEWKPNVASERTLLASPGYYNDYRGVLYDGTIVRGRVHVCLKDNKVYIVHLSCPGWFFTSYTNIYTRIRNTLTVI